jgi:hypothetical protein
VRQLRVPHASAKGTIRDIRVISGSLKNALAKLTIFFGGAIAFARTAPPAESFDRKLAASVERQ